MSQDKSAEIIKFSGAAEPPQQPAPAPEALSGDDAPAASLEELGAGAFLRAARETAKLTIDEASSATKVKAEHLEAIEWMRFDRLPALPYATGFVKAYARYLGLDADAVAAAFKAEAVAAAPAPVAAPAAERALPQGEGARLGSVFAMLAVILFALWVGYQVLGGGRQQAETVAERVEPRPASRPAPQAASRATPRPTPDVETPAAETEAAPAAADLSAPDAAGSETSASPDADASQTLTPEIAPSTEEAAPASEAIGEPAPETEAAPSPVIEEPQERPLPRRVRAAPPPRQPVIVQAELSRSISPDYPNRCTRGADDMESVTMRFDVSAEGRAVNMRVTSSTNSCFETEALNTVARWRFTPRTVDGAPALESSKTATLNFRK